jgi:Domain of unknown function (DUF4388)
MPLIGTMAEFPLPEILQLIGQRTGVLRLLDVSEAPSLEIELYKGNLCSLRLSDLFLQESNEVMKRLSHIIQAGSGMFEFIETAGREPEGTLRLPMNKLAMDLAFMVDEINGITKAHAVKNSGKKRITQPLHEPDPASRPKRKTSRFIYDDEDAQVPGKIE